MVRHSGARRCTVAFTSRHTLDGPVVALFVEDAGRGASAATASASASANSGAGNGLTGLTERVEAVGGVLDVGPGARRGFRLTARVPLGGGAADDSGGSAPGSSALGSSA